MAIIILISIIFILSFVLIFRMVYKGERQEKQEDKGSMWLVLFVTTLLALLVVGALGFMLLVLFGSLNVANSLFGLEFDLKQLVLLTVFFFIYLFTADSIFQNVIEFLLRPILFQRITNLLIRILAFGLIGTWTGLNSTEAILLATGTAVILLLVEVAYSARQKQLTN